MVQHGAWSFGAVCLACDAGPWAPAVLSMTRWEQGVVLTLGLGAPEYRTRCLPLATAVHRTVFACVVLFPDHVLRMTPTPTVLTSYRTQERQYVEADVEARILGAEVPRLPHCRQKHPPGCTIVTATVRFLTGLLIRLPRRLGRGRPDQETPHTRQQPYPQVHHP